MNTQLQPAPGNQVNVNIVTRNSAPSFIIRVIWFLVIGWWLGGLVIALAYVLLPWIVTTPISFWLFNRVGTAMTLRPKSTQWSQHGNLIIQTRTQQRPPLVRVVWFVLIGWWLGAIWLTIAYVLCLLIITWPIGMMMIDRTAGIVTLERN